jgi:hypothetical protein
MEVVHVECGCARVQIDIDVVGANDGGPEQAVLSDAGVEIVDLRAPRTGGFVDVNSDEGEGTVPDVPVSAAIDALHESHVVACRGENQRLAGLPIPPGHRGVHEGDR